MSLNSLEDLIFDFSNVLKNYHKYSEKNIYEYIKNIEDAVDRLILSYRSSKVTDYKYRVFNDLLAEYENVMKAVREAIAYKDYVKARSLLQELITVVRRLIRNIIFLSSDVYLPTAEIVRELEMFVGEGKIAENLDEFDERVKELSYTAKLILSYLYRSPAREMNLKDIPVKIGLGEKVSSRTVSDAVEELTKKLPDIVKLTPDTIRGGFKLVLR